MMRVFLVFVTLLMGASASSPRFQGSLADGLELSLLQTNGGSLSVSLESPGFRTNLTNSEMVDGITFFSEDIPFFGEKAKAALGIGFVSIQSNGRAMRLRLGGMPDVSLERNGNFSITLSHPILSRDAAPIAFRGVIFVGVNASITKQPSAVIVGQSASIGIAGVDVARLTIIQGSSCRGEEARVSRRDNDGDTLVFTPLRGGPLSLCVSEGGRLFQVKGSLLVVGAEGVSIDNATPRAGKMFYVTVFGSGMTNQDTLALSRDACETLHLMGTYEILDFEFSSANRGGFYASVPEQGSYKICYQHSQGSVFTEIGLVDVDKGGDSVIDTDEDTIVVQRDTLVIRNCRIKKLTVVSGALVLDHFHLNVTHFEWSGGSIYGPGVISIMGEGSTINHPDGVVVDFSLKNLGGLHVNLGSLTLSGTGFITNYKRLVLEGGSWERIGVARLVGHRESNAIKNAAGATLTLRGPSGSAVSIDQPLHNYGSLRVVEGAVTCSALASFTNSRVLIDPDANLVVLSGVIHAEIHVDTAGSLRVLPHVLRSVEISNTLVVLGKGSTVELSGRIMLYGSRIEGAGVLSFGGDSPLELSLEGTTTFSFGTTVGISNTALSSTRGSILCFFGNVGVNLEDTTIGDNVVIQSRLATVMFARGRDSTRFIPQKVPLNTSLVIPANTTLVIIETGNRTQEELLQASATPVVCSFFVVVPMYVAAEGDILLRGCAMLPFGGTLNGLVSGSISDNLEASIKTAFCRTALLGGDGCIPALGYQGSGLVLRGDFSSEGLPSSKFKVDQLRLSNGSLEVNRPVSLQSPFFQIDNDARFILNNGGLLEVDSLVLRGLLTMHGELVITGDVDARGGILRLPPSSDCFYPMAIEGAAHYGETVVQCSEPILTPITGALVKSQRFEGIPTIDDGTCAGSSLVAQISMDDQAGLTVYIGERAFITGLLFKISTMGWILALLGLLGWLSGVGSTSELITRPPLQLDLLWTEFSMFVPNLLAGCGLCIEVVILCAPAFLHNVPHTFILNWFARLASYIIEPRDSASAPPMSVICLLATFVWGLAWLPLSGKAFRNDVRQFIEDYRGQMRRRSVRMLFQLHTTAVVVIAPLYVPMLSMLMETVACNTVYESAPSCHHMHTQYWPFLGAAIGLIVLNGFSGINEHFPFSHPPYQRDLDIRFKKAFVLVKSCLLTMLVCTWKVAGSDQWFLVGGSLGIVILLGLTTFKSNPCGYKNVNTFLTTALLYPGWAHVCALFSLAHSRQSPVCSDADYTFVVLIVVGWSIITGWLIYRCGHATSTPGGTGAEDPIGQQLRLIMEDSMRIEEYRSDLYNAASERERDIISHSLSALKLRLLQRLTIFRHMKECIMMSYYLGVEVAEDYVLPQPQLPMDLHDDFPDVSKSLPLSSESDTEPLTVDLMDSYVRGPQLGSGSYGAVFMGMLSATGRLVAVKEVRISSKRKDALSQVKKEVDFLKSLSHPNIVQYFGCRNRGGVMLVFMEFATGGSLTSLVRKFGRLQEAVVGMYAQQLLTGLAFLHSRGIVHRDIKGDNILIGSSGVAKLADFGCSKMLADIANTSEEGCGTLIGSPYWMAPEVIRSEAYGTKADIWSVGCTVVEMLNGGEPAWREKFDTAYAAMYFIGHSTEEYPTNIPSGVSDGCRDFLRRCFERDVSKRADATELLNHPWLREAQVAPCLENDYTSPASVSMESTTRTVSTTADASFEREMSSLA